MLKSLRQTAGVLLIKKKNPSCSKQTASIGLTLNFKKEQGGRMCMWQQSHLILTGITLEIMNNGMDGKMTELSE